MKFRSEINESLTLAFAEAARERRSNGLSILSLGLGEPDFNTPPVFVKSVADVLAEGNSKYSSANGLPALKIKISEKFKKDNDITAPPENIVICAGAKPALSLALMAIVQPGDEVLVVSPSFVSFVPQVLLAEPDVQIKRIPLSSVDLSLPMDKVRAEISDRTRAIIINTPNNPAGSVLSSDSLKELYDLSVEKDFYIISDEVYEKLTHEDDHVSIGSFESELSRVITINGFSKSHAMTGWRLGYVCLPSELMPTVSKIQQHMNTNTCTFVQEAAARAWDLNCPHLIEYRDVLKRRVEILRQWSEQQSAISCRIPTAGFFGFLSISCLGMNSNDFCAGLLAKTGVATTPGLAFGPEWDDHFRISFAVDDNDLYRGLDLISEHVSGFV